MADSGYRLHHDGRSAADPRRDALTRDEGKNLCSSAVHELAHELKTPISAIAAAAEIMRDERLGPLSNERYRDYIGDIHESAAQMLKLIDRLLARRVLEQAAEGLEPVEIDTGALVRATASALEPLAMQAGLNLSVEIAPNIPPLVADPTSVRQVLVNLLNNALKFTPRGGAVIIDAHQDAQGRVVIAVTDTGLGLSEDDLKRALDGVRCHPQQDEGRGAGIGLRLVKALSQANGAEFVLSSKLGQGTRAAVTFNRPGERAAAIR
jgi:signal transduction histidine kinase